MPRATQGAGERSVAVSIERLSGSDDSTGGETTTWARALGTWAEFWPVSSGGEKGATTIEQVIALATFKVRIPYAAGITPKDRLRAGDDLFDILSVDNVRRENRYLDLEVKQPQ